MTAKAFVVGVTCQQNGCTDEATVIVHWPGQDTAMCAKHSVRAHVVAGAMGFVLSCTAIVALCLALLTACGGSHHATSTSAPDKPSKLAHVGDGHSASDAGGQASSGHAGHLGNVVGLADAGSPAVDAGMGDAGDASADSEPLDASTDMGTAGKPSMSGTGGMEARDAGMLPEPEPCKPGIDPSCHVCPHPVAPRCCSQCQCMQYSDGCVERISGQLFYPATASGCGC